MLAEPRFDGVTVVLTVAAGSAATVLARCGLERAAIGTIPLVGLDRAEIDQIVSGHGLSGEAFRSHVVEVAHGSPWLAHAACVIAAERRIFRWSDTDELLRQLVDRRLRHAGFDSDEHRAAAVALALLTKVNDSNEIATLAGVVTGLPSDAHRLDMLLEDLAQAGITTGRPYVISPAVAAPVLVAGALVPSARVRIRIGSVLRMLGRAAMLARTAAPPPPGDYSVLGIGPQPQARPDRVPVIDADRLAAQLSVLTQAARQGGDLEALGMLREAVLELLPAGADVAAWLDALTVAAPVAAAVPQLAGDLSDALTSNWPPPAAAAYPWGDDPELRYRFDVEALVKKAISVGQQTGYSDVNRAVNWVLECARLSASVLGAASTGLAVQAVRCLLRTRIRSAAQTWDDVLGRRQQVLDAVLRWGRNLRTGPPADSRQDHSPAVAARVLLAALTPLLTLITEEHGFGTPGDARVFLWSHYVMPDDPRATAILNAAADAAAGLLDSIDPQSPAAKPALQAIIRLPREIRAEAARGLGHDQPLPAYATAAMSQAASRISRAVASHWSVLPLPIRYAAAEATARPGGRHGSSLAELASGGDPVAAAAVADPALEQILTILPIAQPHSLGTHAAEEAGARLGRAQDLAARLSANEAIDLLTLINPETASSQHYDCLTAFARAVGQTATDPQLVLARLLTETFPGDISLLSGLLQTWPRECFRWLAANAQNGHVVRLGLWVADELPVDQEETLLDAMTAQLAEPRIGNAAEVAAEHAMTDRPGAVDNRDDPGRLALMGEIVAHLGRCRGRPADRLTRLVALSDAAPGSALPRILAAADRILAAMPEVQALDGEANGSLRRELANILTRALTATEGVLGSEIDHDTATAAEALGRAAPAETAQILTGRTLTAERPVIPHPWNELLVQARPEQREPLAMAYRDRIEPLLGCMPSDIETVALDVLAVLGSGTPSWIALVRGWAAGDATGRARAVRAIRRYWHDPIWRELIPGLLDAGVGEQATTELRQGLLPINDAIDALGLSHRLAALQPMIDDPRPVVRQFAAEASQNLRRLAALLRH